MSDEPMSWMDELWYWG